MANNIKNVVYLLIGVLVALPLLLSISGLVNPMSDYLTDTDNNTIEKDGSDINTTYVYELEYGDTQYDNDEAIKNLVIENDSGTEFVEDTDYTANLTAGTFQLKNTTTTYNSDYAIAEYDYQDKSYLNTGLSRTLVGLIVGFFALAILAMVIGKILGLFNQEVR